MSALEVKNYRHWLADTAKIANALDAPWVNEPDNLRQHHSGEDVNEAILVSLLGGFPNRLSAQVKDYTPADHTRAAVCMKLNSEPSRRTPRLIYTATAWENFIRMGSGTRLIENVEAAMKAELESRVLRGTYRIPGLDPETVRVQREGLAPRSTSEPAFPNLEFCRPALRDGRWSLPIRKDVLDEWRKSNPLALDALDRLIEHHNQEVNPSGEPHDLMGAGSVSQAAVAVCSEKFDETKQLPDLEGQLAEGEVMPGQAVEVQLDNQPRPCSA